MDNISNCYEGNEKILIALPVLILGTNATPFNLEYYNPKPLLKLSGSKRLVEWQSSKRLSNPGFKGYC